MKDILNVLKHMVLKLLRQLRLVNVMDYLYELQRGHVFLEHLERRAQVLLNQLSRHREYP